jgi:hypothetical protein
VLGDDLLFRQRLAASCGDLFGHSHAHHAINLETERQEDSQMSKVKQRWAVTRARTTVEGSFGTSTTGSADAMTDSVSVTAMFASEHRARTALRGVGHNAFLGVLGLLLLFRLAVLALTLCQPEQQNHNSD